MKFEGLECSNLTRFSAPGLQPSFSIFVHSLILDLGGRTLVDSLRHTVWNNWRTKYIKMLLLSWECGTIEQLCFLMLVLRIFSPLLFILFYFLFLFCFILFIVWLKVDLNSLPQLKPASQAFCGDAQWLDSGTLTPGARSGNEGKDLKHW